ncbi:EAL domain-containing protein [Mobilitalea sibirica]|uniref:EAL domain-containing protein n=1 Tax=Mobilitalea sibirica TaxID=1462919 RepID=A0A8J7KUS5_9FIRM|nr:EAL domain-containing protein [Mobilitalea sibirica]MBH1939340.1 EAL domain-containing protein [Mobilitalea sibirica]
MSIKKSLRILLIISSIIPVVLVSVIAHGLLTHRLISVQTDNLQKIAETNQSGLVALIETQRTEVSLLSIHDEIQSLVRISNQTDNYSPDAVNKLLTIRKNSYKDCEIMTLYNFDREIIASSNPSIIGFDGASNISLSYMFATKNFAVGVSGIKPYVFNSTKKHTIEIGYPILEQNSDSETILGYLISTLGLSYFEDFLSSISIGETGYGILLDKDGTVIYHPVQELIGNNIHADRLSSIVDDYNKGLIPSSGKFEYFHDSSNRVYGYCVIPELDWVLLVKQDISELRSLTSIILSLLIFICAVLLIFIIIFAHSLTKRFTAPIIALRDAMKTASDGNLTVQSNIKSKNELGELSKNFNKMLHIIKTNYEDLASMHEELLSNEEQLRTNYDHIEYLAYHDTLTNLPNKLAFLDYVNAALISSPRASKSHAVYFVDLDNFKTVNDTLGHEYGDSLLIKTAQILTSIMGENGMLARAGGDEFLIFKENISSKEEAVAFASEMIDCFRNPLNLGDEVVYVSMSIGIAVYPENGLSPNALIKNADIAMYKSKDTGKNKFTIFDSKMEEELNRNTLIVEVLRNAIDNKEVYIQYQPLIELETTTVIGYEALMRIRSERLGSITPEEFIPIAEESGLIIELSSWLLKEVCNFNKELIDMGIPPRPVSVNISSIQINRPGFISLLREVLEETGLPPQYLELEITESSLVSSIMDATELLNTLQELGVKVSLDDFGTGYSSLNYLTKMPINTLKIDKSFIDNICYSEKDSQIAKSIIQLAHSLNIKVVAEGVEYENQLALLKEQKCDIIQGFIYSGPLHAPALIDMIRKA